LVASWIVVIAPRSIPICSWSTLTTRARHLTERCNVTEVNNG